MHDLLLQLLREMPPFLREKMPHDLLKTLDYKLTESELKELHEYLNPVYPTAVCWPVTNDTTAVSQVSTNVE
jgi:hypothetical protein